MPALVEAITNASRENLESVLTIIEKTGSLAYTARVAREQANKAQEALSALPDSEYREALAALAKFSVDRAY